MPPESACRTAGFAPRSRHYYSHSAITTAQPQRRLPPHHSSGEPLERPHFAKHPPAWGLQSHFWTHGISCSRINLTGRIPRTGAHNLLLYELQYRQVRVAESTFYDARNSTDRRQRRVQMPDRPRGHVRCRWRCIAVEVNAQPPPPRQSTQTQQPMATAPRRSQEGHHGPSSTGTAAADPGSACEVRPHDVSRRKHVYSMSCGASGVLQMHRLASAAARCGTPR